MIDFSKINGFPPEKLAKMFQAHAEYNALKAELFASTIKVTDGKANTNDDGFKAAKKWYTFVSENSRWTTDKLSVADFLAKLNASELLALVELAESEDQALSKVLHDIISSDLRYYWKVSEGFYDDIPESNTLLKEKYKDLPSIAPKRKTDAQIEKAFQQLEAKRNKKNGGSVLPTT